MTTDKVVCGVDLADLLFGCTDEIPCCHRNQPWTPFNDTCNVADTSDLLDALFLKSESSSAVASPLWSPCTTDSSTTEDPPTDPTESFPSSFCAGFPIADTPSFPPSLECQPAPAQKNPYVSIDLGWESCHLQQDFGIAYYLSKTQASPLSPHQPLTVKDLLLSNLGKTGQQIPQHSPQELILNEDEKKLLAKEGVKLPGKLPLSKLEERVLKKIRRKIRNKRSAQESRKKRREYVDDLEGRMSACSANNLELQRKIQRLEETNNALLEQLSRLQALLPNSPSTSTHKGTCILVLLLSFSLLISSSLQPEPYSQLGRSEHTQTKVVSRSLPSLEEMRGSSPLPPVSISRGFEDSSS
ncbi:cyclic AMP-responsive element-binding protein 3-like protein 3-A isoform X2 [Takifugu flavidus]|uniref:Cyclic AMP-responsive element-binding protein 3-like protein 3-A n=1 Tax=Takifugu flavidus TaxID=433684 RepID=A0A5C6NZF2_9TELE|nr:cyclic AMP-responsive element-binding protein 3-like protein 3-A isoform X2 [Takifugu flavidus]TWW72653.1 Cyclic AMP-responsive element-binding protein 3-like protein 3-A [Takifugu flavidus]